MKKYIVYYEIETKNGSIRSCWSKFFPYLMGADLEFQQICKRANVVSACLQLGKGAGTEVVKKYRRDDWKKTSTKETAILRRYQGTSDRLLQERRTITPVDALLSSFAEVWPFSTIKAPEATGQPYVIDVFNTQASYVSGLPLFRYTILPLTD